MPARDDSGYFRLASGKNAAKNRAAQQRYRERQKSKFKEYEQQIETLGRRLANLETENESLGERNRLLERLAQLAEQSGQEPDEPTELSSDEQEPSNVWQRKSTAAAVANLMNTVRRNKPPLVTTAEAALMKPEELKTAKATYVQNLAVLMLQGTEPGSESLKELEDYVLQHRNAWVQLVKSLSLKVVARMLAAKSDQPPTFKESVLAVIQLSPDQKRHLLQIRRTALEELEEIKQSRLQAARALSQSVDPSEPSFSGADPPDHMLLKMRASDRLRANITAEHQWMSRNWHKCVQILTPLQEAKALIECFPDTWLDVWLLAGYVEAEEDGTLQSWLPTFSRAEGIQRFLEAENQPAAPAASLLPDTQPHSPAKSEPRKMAALEDHVSQPQMSHPQMLPIGLDTDEYSDMMLEDYTSSPRDWDGKEVDEFLELLAVMPKAL